MKGSKCRKFGRDFFFSAWLHSSVMCVLPLVGLACVWMMYMYMFRSTESE